MPSGPLPKPEHRRNRRNAVIAMRTLPAAGRTSKRAPNWPLPDDPRGKSLVPVLADEIEDLRAQVLDEADGRKRRSIIKRLDAKVREHAELVHGLKQTAKLEREIWTALWRTPMAVEWEKMRWLREVAAYARHKARAELGDLDEAKRAVAFADRLGLTPWSLQRLRWEIGPATPATGPGIATVTTLPTVAVDDAVNDFS